MRCVFVYESNKSFQNAVKSSHTIVKIIFYIDFYFRNYNDSWELRILTCAYAQLTAMTANTTVNNSDGCEKGSGT